MGVRVLFLSPRESWPPTSGARLRDFHFAQALAEQAELTYLYFSREPASSQLAEHLPSAKMVRAFPAPQRYTPGKILRGAVGRYPLPVQNYTSPEMLAAVTSVLQEEAFDIVHLDSIHLAAYLDPVARYAPQALTVLNWHNIESELMERYADHTPSYPRRLYARLTGRSLYRLETRMLRQCFGHIVCSAREQVELLRRAPSSRIQVFENGVDTNHYQAASAARRGSHLLFVGQMAYHANVEAVLWFARQIWPALQRWKPALQLMIVGSDPVASIKQLDGHCGIRVTGTVPEVLPYYQNALAAIVPLQTGGGTRLKILEAMACQTPVISTALGAEGLDVTDGENILLANSSAQSWVHALEQVKDPAVAAALTQNARRLVCSQYNWKSIGNRLVQQYFEWVAETKKP